MKTEKVTKNDQKQIDKAKDDSRIREEKITKVFAETMRIKKSKE